jgi:hypothetical protein
MQISSENRFFFSQMSEIDILNGTQMTRMERITTDLTIRSYKLAGFLSLNYLRINIFLFLLSYPANTETLLAGKCCYALAF